MRTSLHERRIRPGRPLRAAHRTACSWSEVDEGQPPDQCLVHPRWRDDRSCLQRARTPFGGDPLLTRLCKFVARLHAHPVFGGSPADTAKPHAVLGSPLPVSQWIAASFGSSIRRFLVTPEIDRVAVQQRKGYAGSVEFGQCTKLSDCRSLAASMRQSISACSRRRRLSISSRSPMLLNASSISASTSATGNASA